MTGHLQRMPAGFLDSNLERPALLIRGEGLTCKEPGLRIENLEENLRIRLRPSGVGTRLSFESSALLTPNSAGLHFKAICGGAGGEIRGTEKCLGRGAPIDRECLSVPDARVAHITGTILIARQGNAHHAMLIRPHVTLVASVVMQLYMGAEICLHIALVA